MRMNNKKNFFAVGEYWSGDLDDLRRYMSATQGCMCLFDVPLHLNFYKACNQAGYFDMAHLLDSTLVQDNPTKAVTFVENHDTQYRDAKHPQDPIKRDTLATNAYLLAMPGTPCVFLPHWKAYKQDIKAMIDVKLPSCAIII